MFRRTWHLEKAILSRRVFQSLINMTRWASSLPLILRVASSGLTSAMTTFASIGFVFVVEQDRDDISSWSLQWIRPQGIFKATICFELKIIIERKANINKSGQFFFINVYWRCFTTYLILGVLLFKVCASFYMYMTEICKIWFANLSLSACIS